MEPAQLFGYLALALTILGALAIFASNVLYSRPRIEAQSKRIRDLEDQGATTAAQLIERDKRISFLEEMVKSVPAFAELTAALRQLVAATQEHEQRSESREERIVRALEAIVGRLDKHA